MSAKFDFLDEPERSIRRALTAIVLAAGRHADPATILKNAWPNDERARTVLRAVSNPTMLADYPVANVIGLFRSLAPKSAALQLFDLGRSVDLTGLNTVSIPAIDGLPPVIFVAEGAPAPVTDIDFGTFVVGPPRKILILAAVTRELDNANPQGAVNIVSTILGDAVGKGLDVAAFGTAAASASAPAGLLHGVTPLTASAATTALSAMIEDLGALVEAIAEHDIDPTDVVFVGGPKQALAIKMFVGSQFDYPILSSVALKGSVAAFASQGVASAYADPPQVETSNQAMMHYDDTAPAADPLTKGPTRSAFQQELIAIKVRGRCVWAAAPGAAQIVNGVTW